MKIEITKNVQKVEIIEVELPYYFKKNLGSDFGEYVIYGKIEETQCTSIIESENLGGVAKYEIEVEWHSSIKNTGLASYFDAIHIGSKEEFEAVKKRCKSFLIAC